MAKQPNSSSLVEFQIVEFVQIIIDELVENITYGKAQLLILDKV